MNDMTVSKALRWLFIAQILCLFGFIPVVGAILAIVAFVMNLMALYGAGKLEEGYKTAFMLSIVGIVLSVLGLIFRAGILASIIDILSAIVSLGVLYYVIMTTVNLLQNCGASDVAAKGLSVWKLNLICTIAAVVLTLVGLISVVLAAVIAVIVAIVAIVAGIMYIVFLNKSSKALA